MMFWTIVLLVVAAVLYAEGVYLMSVVVASAAAQARRAGIRTAAAPLVDFVVVAAWPVAFPVIMAIGFLVTRGRADESPEPPKAPLYDGW